MKIIFLLTVLANIIFFLWEYNSGGFYLLSNNKELDSKEAKQILLVNELNENKSKFTMAKVESTEKKPLSKTEPSSKKTADDTGSKNKFCYLTGPFENSKALEKWRILNKLRKSSLTPVNKEVKITQFLVYYPRAANLSESKKNLEFLKKKGVSDVWLFQKGELKGAISLGIFSRALGALHLKSKMMDVDVDVKLKTIYKNKTKLFSRISTTKNNLKHSIILSGTQGIVDC